MTSEVLAEKKWRWFPMEFRIALRIFLSLIMFCMIIDRWVTIDDKMELVCDPSNLNPTYAKEIDIETYLMTDAQLNQLFTDSSSFVTWEKRIPKILNDSAALYFVLRVRNTGDRYAWGRIKAHSERWCRGSGIEGRLIQIEPLPPKMNSYSITILAASTDISGFDFLNSNQKLSSSITTEWLSLYTSGEGE